MKRLTVVLATLIWGVGLNVYPLEGFVTASLPAIEEGIEVVWNIAVTSPANQTHPGVSYDSTRDQVLAIWEDGRNDPQGRVDSYGFDYNSDIFGQVYDADGQAVGTELSIATDGEHQPGSGRYDNEQWPTLHYDPGSDKHAIFWMTLPNVVLTAGDLRTTTCYDLYFRTYQTASASLSPNILDVAWYTASPDLRDPWDNYYDWSCQQEPASTLLASDVSLIVWHDHRERYEQISGIAVEKDIYAQVIENGVRSVEESVLISHGVAGPTVRLPRTQERPDIAGQGGQRLIVWEDERNSATSNYRGYRDIYGRFVTYADGVLTPGAELEIAMGSEGDTSTDYKMASPRVGYMSDIDAYVIVWSKILNYTDVNNDSFQLMQAIVSGDGQFLQTPVAIPATESDISHTPDIACSGNRCALVYRKGDNGMIMVASLMIADGTFVQEIPLDQIPHRHTYPRLVTGRTLGAQIDFFVGYVVDNVVRVARISTTADPPFTLTPTPSSTLTPTTSTPTPSPTPTTTVEPRFLLEVSIDPFYSGGNVTQNPSPDPDGRYADGSAVTLVASPNQHFDCLSQPYWSFTGWQGDIVAPSSTMMLVMDSDKSVKAIYQEFFPPTCTPTPTISRIYLPVLLVQP